MSRNLHTGSSAYSSYSSVINPPYITASSSSSSSFTGPVEAYSTCISDSQLAVLDIEGIMCDVLTATVLHLSGSNLIVLAFIQFNDIILPLCLPLSFCLCVLYSDCSREECEGC